jgi:hypothetical protein
MSDWWVADTTKLTIEVSTLARKLGEASGDAFGNAADLGDDDAWRVMVNAADEDSDAARAFYGVIGLGEGLAQGFGSDFIDSFNKAFFDGYVERVRRRLDELQ